MQKARNKRWLNHRISRYQLGNTEVLEIGPLGWTPFMVVLMVFSFIVFVIACGVGSEIGFSVLKVSSCIFLLVLFIFRFTIQFRWNAIDFHIRYGFLGLAYTIKRSRKNLIGVWVNLDHDEDGEVISRFELAFGQERNVYIGRFLDEESRAKVIAEMREVFGFDVKDR